LKASDRVVLWSIFILTVASIWSTWAAFEYPESIKSILLTFSIVGLILLVIAVVVELALPAKKS